MDRVRNEALQAEALNFEDLLREEMKELTRAIADDPFSKQTRNSREKSHALRIELLRMIQQFGDSYEENATFRRILRLDAELDRLISAHDKVLDSRRRHH